MKTSKIVRYYIKSVFEDQSFDMNKMILDIGKKNAG